VVPKATGFDGRGNYNLGVIGANYLPEIDIDKVNKISGMDIPCNCKTDKEAKFLLTELDYLLKELRYG
jgi:large subunit ribosomal protein L5